MRFKQFLKEAVPEPGDRYVLKAPFDCAREFGGSTYLNAGAEIEVVRIQDSPFGMQVVYKIVDEPGTYTEGLRVFSKIMFKGTKDDWNKSFLDDLKESTQEEPILYVLKEFHALPTGLTVHKHRNTTKTMVFVSGTRVQWIEKKDDRVHFWHVVSMGGPDSFITIGSYVTAHKIWNECVGTKEQFDRTFLDNLKD